MVLVRLLSNDRTRIDRWFEYWPVKHAFGAFPGQAVPPGHTLRPCGNILLDDHGANLAPAGCSDPIHGHALIDEPVVAADNVIIDDGGAVVNLFYASGRDPVQMRTGVVHMSKLDVGEKVRPEMEIEVDSHADVIEAPAVPDFKARAGWQRRPAAMAIRITPGNPGRAPNQVREPDPPVAIMMMPPAIVKSPPAP